MKIISLFVAFCFSLNVMAASGTIKELERHLDDYHYALSVEWDQQDDKFYQAQTSAFYAKLKQLIMEKGISQEQILSLVEGKVNDKAALEALKLRLSLANYTSSPEELARIVRESSKDFYAQGASWSAGSTITIVGGLLVAAVIGYAIWWSANHKCVAYEMQYVCQNYSNCHYGSYYDSYYGGYYCYGPGYTTCGWANVCTQYARK
jgi:hypothetical protein